MEKTIQPEAQPQSSAPQAADTTPASGITPTLLKKVRSVYPEPGAASQASAPVPGPAPMPAAAEDTQLYKSATAGMYDAIVFISGLASTCSYLFILYYVKNVWATAIVSVLFALVAVVLSTVNHRSGARMSPFTVIGLSAATIALVYIANMLILRAITYSSFGI